VTNTLLQGDRTALTLLVSDDTGNVTSSKALNDPVLALDVARRLGRCTYRAPVARDLAAQVLGPWPRSNFAIRRSIGRTVQGPGTHTNIDVLR